MTSRDRTIIGAIVTLVLVVGSWILVIQPKRDQASKLGGQITAANTQLQVARTQVAQGQAARSSYATSYKEVARLGEAVPPDDNVPSMIYQLQSAASGSRVDFRSLQLTASGGSVPTPPPAAAKSSPSAAQAATALLPPGATVGPAGFPIEPFAFSFQGNFFHLADFFNRLQRFVIATNKQVSVSGRLMTLNAISLGPAPQGFPQITARISATTYLVPATQGLTNGASPSGPGSSSTQAVSSSGSSTSPPAATVSAP